MRNNYLGKSQIFFANVSDPLDVRIVMGFGMINTFPRHVHTTYCIGLVTNGVRIIKQSGKLFYVSENKIFSINPGESHACGSATDLGHSYQIICIGCEYLQNAAKQIMDKDSAICYFRSPIIVDALLGKKIIHFNEIVKQRNALIEKETILMSIMSRLILKHSAFEPQLLNIPLPRNTLNRVCEYIHGNYTENISLVQLSRIANVSSFHMHRSFVKVKGLTPHEYLMQIRIKNALDMLRRGFSQTETAYKIGFSDQSHFSRTFKRIIGVPPGKFVSDNCTQHIKSVNFKK